MQDSFHQMLFTRHSIRRYTDKPVSGEDVKTILEAALLSPSSKSARPWQFVVVENREKLQAMAKCKDFGSHPIAGAAFAVVVLADPGKSEVFIEDATYAAALMQLQAESLGLGSCWIQVRGRSTGTGESSEEYIQALLNIPQYLKVECIVTFGYKNEVRKPVDPAKLLWEKVHIEEWKDNVQSVDE